MEQNQHLQEQTTTTPKVNPNKLKSYLAQVESEQNLPLAVVAGITAAIITAILWAVVTVATGYQIGYMAIAVGFLVGFAVRFLGKGLKPVFGIIGAICALLGCALGNAFSVIGQLANVADMPYLQAFGELAPVLPQMITGSFQPIDLLFYGIALFVGYSYSFRELTEEELAANVVD